MDGKRSFFWTDKAYYADALRGDNDYVAEIMFGMYFDGGGTSGEMAMRWKELSNNERPVPQLQVFDDAWAVLATMGDVIERMGAVNDKNITPPEFVAILTECGFVDATPYTNPQENDPTWLKIELSRAEMRAKELRTRLDFAIARNA